MKDLFKWLFGRKEKAATLPKNEAHVHKWELQYRTGNPHNGQSEVCKCKCEQWAVRHYGTAVYILLEK